MRACRARQAPRALRERWVPWDHPAAGENAARRETLALSAPREFGETKERLDFQAGQEHRENQA